MFSTVYQQWFTIFGRKAGSRDCSLLQSMKAKTQLFGSYEIFPIYTRAVRLEELHLSRSRII